MRTVQPRRALHVRVAVAPDCCPKKWLASDGSSYAGAASKKMTSVREHEGGRVFAAVVSLAGQIFAPSTSKASSGYLFTLRRMPAERPTHSFEIRHEACIDLETF